MVCKVASVEKIWHSQALECRTPIMKHTYLLTSYMSGIASLMENIRYFNQECNPPYEFLVKMLKDLTALKVHGGRQNAMFAI